jgi:hypothetical protein
MNSVIGSIMIFALLALVFNVDHAVATRAYGGLRGSDSIDADSEKRRDLSGKSSKSEGSKKTKSEKSGSMKSGSAKSMKSGSAKSMKSKSRL